MKVRQLAISWEAEQWTLDIFVEGVLVLALVVAFWWFGRSEPNELLRQARPSWTHDQG